MSYPSNREIGGGVAKGYFWLIVVIILFGLIGAGFWAFRVATSDVKGRGDSVVQKNSANNRIAAQEKFEQMYADIKASDAKIGPAAQAAKAQPDSTVLRRELTGLQNYCLSVVADYEAASRQYTQQDFKAADLPDAATLADDPSTDCK